MADTIHEDVEVDPPTHPAADNWTVGETAPVATLPADETLTDDDDVAADDGGTQEDGDDVADESRLRPFHEFHVQLTRPSLTASYGFGFGTLDDDMKAVTTYSATSSLLSRP